MKLELPEVPVNGYELRVWKVEQWKVEETLYVYHSNEHLKGLVDEPFDTWWQIYRNGQPVGVYKGGWDTLKWVRLGKAFLTKREAQKEQLLMLQERRDGLRDDLRDVEDEMLDLVMTIEAVPADIGQVGGSS